MSIAFLPFHQRTRQISRGMWVFVSVCVATFVALCSSITTAEAQITCTGVPFNKGGGGMEIWYFDTTNGTCSNVGPAPNDGFTVRTRSNGVDFLNQYNGGVENSVSDDDGGGGPIGVSANNISPHPNFIAGGANPWGVWSSDVSAVDHDTFSFQMTITFQGVNFTIDLSMRALAVSNNHEISSMVISGGNFVLPPDTTPPTVAITGVPAETNDPFTATYTFNEEMDPATLDLADVQAGLSNATASNLQTATADTVFTALITPNGTGPVTVALLANAADDLAGNGNLASGVSLAQHTSPQDVARQQIGDYVAARHSLIMQNRPSTDRRLSRFSDTGINGGEMISAFGMSLANPARFAMAFAGNELSFAMRSDRVAPVLNAFAAGDGLDTIDAYENDTRVTFWTEGRFTLFDDDATDNGRFGVVHAGVDYLVNERVLLGFSAQVDWLSQDNASNAGSLNGVGWLAGPTLTLQVQDNFYVDLAAALGQSYNDINPLGTYTDEFTTNRLFLSGGLIGDFEVGLFTLQPGVFFNYIAEEQKAYTDSNAALVASQTLSQGEVRFGPKIARTFPLVGGDSLSAFASLDGVYTFGDTGGYADGSLAADMIGFTGSTELGATYATRSGLALTIAANYGGIGSDANLYGGRLRLSVPLN